MFEFHRSFKQSLAFLLIAIVPAAGFGAEFRGDGPRAQIDSDSGLAVPILDARTADVISYSMPEGKVREIVRGETAYQQLQKTLAVHPQRFKNAIASLTARGSVPSGKVTIIRDRNKEVSSLNDAVSDTTAEVYFWGWDNGSLAAWEGAIHAVRFSDNSWYTTDTSVDVTTDQFPVMWDTVTDSSGPTGPRNNMSLDADGTVDALGTIGSYGPMKSFLRCLKGCCSGWAVACIFTGLAWIDCFIIMCFGYCHIYCALDVIFFA